jgi:hypothetical protein
LKLRIARYQNKDVGYTTDLVDIQDKNISPFFLKNGVDRQAGNYPRGGRRQSFFIFGTCWN